MTPETQIVLSGALTFGVPLFFAMRELRGLRRPGPGPDDRDRAPDPTPPLPPEPPALKPLPDCLIPKLSPAVSGERPRVLEPV